MTLFTVTALVAYAFLAIVVLILGVLIIATVLDRVTGCLGADRRGILESRVEHRARLLDVKPATAWPTVAGHLVVERARAEHVAAVVSLEAYRAERGWDAA